MLLVDMNNWAAALGCAVAPSWWNSINLKDSLPNLLETFELYDRVSNMAIN
jgi:hypothetical protein